MEQRHPPIPPNSQHFSHSKTCGWGLNSPFGEGIFCPIVMATDEERPIIAAVARCAWLDEVGRLDADKRFSSGRPFLSVLEKKFQQYRDAQNNADAWRVWGISK